MDTVRDGLRAQKLEKDVYDRVVCVDCDRPLKRRNEPDELWDLRYCEECGSEWVEKR